MAKAIIMCGGAGGSAASDDCTALKSHVLAGKTAVTKDSGDEPVEGTMLERGDWNGSVGMNGSITIPGGHHGGGGKVTGPAVTQLGAWTSRLGINGKIVIPEGYHNGKGYVDQEIPTQGALIIKPGTTAKVEDVKGKYMTGNITVPAISIPANVIKNGHKLTFPDGSSVTGNVKELKFRYIAVTSGTSADIDYGNGYMYSLRFTVDIIPIMGWALNYRGNRKRDISIWHNQDGVGKTYDAVNLNQDMRWDMFSIGLDDGEGGCSLFSKNLVIPVSYGGETYGCWIVGH